MGRLSSGRWRVRWRETEADEATGAARAVQRERVVEDEATAVALRAKVLRALETGEPPELDAVRRIPAVASADEVFAGYIRARAARGAAAGSIRQYGLRGKRALIAFRALGEIPESAAVPGSWLTREHLIDLTRRLQQDGHSVATVHGTVAMVIRAWTWAADDPGTYPGLATPPRDAAAVRPEAPAYQASVAPTMAECDAVIRRLPRSRTSLPVAVIGRSTGLRVSQILALTVGDVDLGASTLAVTTGKSKREKLGRVVPIATHLRDWLVPLVAGREPGDLLVGRRRDARVRTESPPTRTLVKAWTEATRAGEVREEVWAPTNREIRRPDHAFRAAFQAHLVEAGIRDEVIDRLVGHAGKSVRDRHYVDASARWSAMVDAVATIPPIDWSEAEEEAPDNVVPMTR